MAFPEKRIGKVFFPFSKEQRIEFSLISGVKEMLVNFSSSSPFEYTTSPHNYKLC